MPTGVVTARPEVTLPLPVRGPTGVVRDVSAVIDTGYTGEMTLPPALCVTLGLIRQSTGGVRLADGSVRKVDVFTAEVAWDGGWRTVAASAVGDEVLIGMRFLLGHLLTIAVTPGGAVTISPIP